MKLVILSVVVLTALSCKRQAGETDTFFKSFIAMEEIQLTSGNKGHFLHTTQYFSPNDRWIAYDTRNDGSHIGRTCCIEIVKQRVFITHIQSGQTRQVSHKPREDMAELRAIDWSNDGNMLAYNRKIAAGDKAFFQVFLLK